MVMRLDAAALLLMLALLGSGARAAEGDLDEDGISDLIDACGLTAPGSAVDSRGCELTPTDSDGDGVADRVDACAQTSAGLHVDARGCALDTDRDGIGDGLDRCEATGFGTAVDALGCAPGQTAVPAPVSPAPAIAVEPTATPVAAADADAGLAPADATPAPAGATPADGAATATASDAASTGAPAAAAGDVARPQLALTPPEAPVDDGTLPLESVPAPAPATAPAQDLGPPGVDEPPADGGSPKGGRTPFVATVSPLPLEIAFAPGSVALGDGARAALTAALAAIHQLLVEEPKLRLEAIGYATADEPGDLEKLSERRAWNVRAWLVAQGVAPYRVRFSYRGASVRPAGKARVELRRYTGP